MNPHDDRLQIPPPPECESCPHDRREKGGDGHMRYWCASAMPRHPGCVEHPDNFRGDSVSETTIDVGRTVGRRVVCAAALNAVSKQMVVGPRHWDDVMRRHLGDAGYPPDGWVQGFIDQQGVFMNRHEAWEVAKAAGQIIRHCGGDDGRLFSENLY